MHFVEVAGELVLAQEAVVVACKLAVGYWAGKLFGILAMHHGGVSFEIAPAFGDEGAVVGETFEVTVLTEMGFLVSAKFGQIVSYSILVIGKVHSFCMTTS